jgi:hypothetical protein
MADQTFEELLIEAMELCPDAPAVARRLAAEDVRRQRLADQQAHEALRSAQTVAPSSDDPEDGPKPVL